MTLNELKAGQHARIVQVTGDDALTTRLLEMGLIEGQAVELLGTAPLGDPRQYYIQGFRLALRSREAQRIQIELQNL